MKHGWKRWLSVLLAGVLMLSLLGGCSEGSTGGSNPSGASSYEAEVLRLVNEIREENGLPKFSTSASLNAAAARRAEELSVSFSHTRPDNSSCFTVLGEFGITYRAAGENVAAGQPSPQAVVNSWMNSPKHRENILNSAFTRMGVGYIKVGSGYGTYWVQLFTG